MIEIILTSLASGLLGVIISNYYHKRASKNKQKYDLLEQLMGSRYDILGENFTEGLNRIFVVYNDNENVMKALRAFHKCIQEEPSTKMANDKLKDIFIEMCRDLKIDTKIVGNDFFLQAFNIRR